MSCGRVRDWLHRDVETLDDAARLLLDDHLASCARCRDDRAQLQHVRALGESLTAPPPGAREYNRAIARALLEGSPRSSAAAAPARPRVWIPLAAFAAVAAAAVVGYVVLRDDGGARSDRGTTAAGAEPGSSTPRLPERERSPAVVDIVDDGVVHAGSTAFAAGDPVPADTSLRADTSARLRLASARVVLALGGELRWLPAERTILLERGAVEVDSPSPGVARVVSGRFTAELDDADLAIEPTAVRVRRGQVTIFAASGGAVLAQLEAGDVWTLPEPPRPARTQPAAPSPTVAELMARARRQFAARQYADAERTTEEALALGPRRADEAEARIFLGDIAQATGDLATAARRYAAVADSFTGEPAAESALYAAARIELRRGRTAAARTLLARYLDRHPAGRYADDVRRELDALPPAQPAPRSNP